MRQIIKLLGVAMLVAVMFASTERVHAYLPFIEDGRSWEYVDSLSGDDRTPDHYIEVTIGGNVNVDGNVWVKRDFEWHFYNYPNANGTLFNDYLCDKDGLLYRGTNPENLQIPSNRLIIDMNLKEGDTFIEGEVTKVDSICVRGIVRKRISMYTNCCKPQKTAVFVEGIGADNDSYFPDGPISYSDNRFLSKVRDKAGNVIFTQEDFHAPSYSPSGIADAMAEESKDDEMYDIYGRRISNPERGTIYIRGGRKYVAE